MPVSGGKVVSFASVREDDDSNLDVAQNRELICLLEQSLTALCKGNLAALCVLDPLELNFATPRHGSISLRNPNSWWQMNRWDLILLWGWEGIFLRETFPGGWKRDMLGKIRGTKVDNSIHWTQQPATDTWSGCPWGPTPHFLMLPFFFPSQWASKLPPGFLPMVPNFEDTLILFFSF